MTINQNCPEPKTDLNVRYSDTGVGAYITCSPYVICFMLCYATAEVVSSFSSCEHGHQPPLLAASTHQLHHLNDDHHQQQPQPSSIRFSGEQIACLCDAMQQIGHVDRLVAFLWSLSPAELLAGSESVIRARATVAFHQGKYRELYSLLEGHNFDAANHAALQQLWYRAHYAEAEKIRGRPLGLSLIITTELQRSCLFIMIR